MRIRKGPGFPPEAQRRKGRERYFTCPVFFAPLGLCGNPFFLAKREMAATQRQTKVCRTQKRGVAIAMEPSQRRVT
jgi:hypothetical protein